MVDTIRPFGMSAAEIAQAVRNRYSEVAVKPDGTYNFRVGRDFAEALGYPKSLLDDLPASVWEAFTGVATPSLVADVQPGDTVVDLGCGGGFFSVALAKMVGEKGRVIAVDLQAEMLAITRDFASKKGVSNRITLHHCKENDIGLNGYV